MLLSILLIQTRFELLERRQLVRNKVLYSTVYQTFYCFFFFFLLCVVNLLGMSLVCTSKQGKFKQSLHHSLPFLELNKTSVFLVWFCSCKDLKSQCHVITVTLNCII